MKFNLRSEAQKIFSDSISIIIKKATLKVAAATAAATTATTATTSVASAAMAADVFPARCSVA